MIFSDSRAGTNFCWLMLAISLPLTVVAADTIRRINNTQRLEQEGALVQLASSTGLSVDTAVKRLEEGLVVLIGSSALARGDLEGYEREVRLLSDRFGGIRITLMAPDTSLVLRVGETPSGSLADDVPVRQGALAALRAGGAVVTGLLAANDPAHRMIAVAVPSLGSSEASPDFTLVAFLSASRLADMVKLPPSHPKGMVITIYDRGGITVASSSDSDLHVGEPERGGFQALVADRQSGLLPNGEHAGAPVIQAFSKAQFSGYSVVAAVPVRSFGAPVRPQLIETAVTGAAFLALALVAVGYLARRLVSKSPVIDRCSLELGPARLRQAGESVGKRCAVAAESGAAQALPRASDVRVGELVAALDLAAFMVHEVNGTIQFWSQGCARMYGWTREEAIGQSSHKLLRTQFPAPLAQIEHTLLTKGEWNGDLVHRRRDGTLIIVAAHKLLQRGIDGHADTVMEYVVDVTAFRDAQGALGVLDRGLEQRVKATIAAREAAQQQAAHAGHIQALGQLAGGIAHDFNNVLQAVAGAAALIARRPNDAEGVGVLVQVICDAAARGASITRRMLVLARRSDLTAEPLDAETLLDEMRETFIYTLGAAIDVEVQVAANLPRFLADRAQLETAMVNLATNARDAMPNGGILRLLAGFELVTDPHPAGLPAGAYVRMAVVDNGIGMSTATMARVGEPFFTTKDVGKGTGLGLSMVQGFIDQSGGGFTIESAIGAGTRVTLWLPCVASNAGQWLEAAAGASMPRLTGRILLVEDDEVARDALMEQLEAFGHKVLSTSGGTDALAILRTREAVDLMITDLSMPGMNGLTLIKQAHGLCPSLPAILLTGQAGDPADWEDGVAAKGTYTLMRKPASSALLGARVRTLLEHQ
jgi:PAS domain S-box-containing protein